MIPDGQCTRAGFKKLLDDCSTHPEHRRDILWAVSRLTMGHGPVAEQALRHFTPDTQDRQHALGEFKKTAKLQ